MPRDLKAEARAIFAATMAAVDLRGVFARKVRRDADELRFADRRLDLSAFSRIFVVSFGKAAWSSCECLLDVLGDDHRPSAGVIVSNVPVRVHPPGFRAFRGGHPYPNQGSLDAAVAVEDLLRQTDERTLVFFLVSGGGSALLERPVGFDLAGLVRLNEVLVGCGANIDEINAIRKHLSAVKGGRLARLAAPAHVVSFLISDVPEGHLATIASGPTLPDPQTVDDCYAVAARYDLIGRFPEPVADLFRRRALAETPKPEDPAFVRTDALLLAGNRDALEAARAAAEARGFVAAIEDSCDDLDIPATADHLLGRLDEVRRDAGGMPACVVSGGEVRSPVTGDGRGGRNQAFVLHCVARLADRGVVVLSAGTDGIDGNSPAAGALAAGDSLARARVAGLDPDDFFRRSDSFTFFDHLGDTLVPGPQQNNLRDLRLLLAEE